QPVEETDEIKQTDCILDENYQLPDRSENDEYDESNTYEQIEQLD
ncbi:MAG: hypothetical protein Harvfovirus28_16, partial [Harvfovirus sp.]